MSNNPFPGLRPFKQKETHLFFGRDGQSLELLKRLQESRFLALVGVSGSGKSSLIRAGLLPKLEGGLMSSVESDWRVAVFRPGDNPIGNMARALVTEAGLGGESGFEDVEVAIAETTLRRGNLGLLELIREAKRKVRENGEPFLGPNENVLVVVDQFEEIFRIIEQYDELVRVKQLSAGNSDAAANADDDDLKSPKDEASAFVKLLLESTSKNQDKKYDENVYIIVTMRSDYLGDTAQFGGMPEKINEGQYLIPRMDRADRRKAIVGPIAVEGGTITEPLINQLLNDAGEDPRRLPILQHALMRIWDLAERSPQNGGLNLDHYEKIEGLSGALSQHANEAFKDLSKQHQDLAAKIFKSLTEKGLANREIRRPRNIADICAVVGAQEEDVKTVVDCFRKPGRWFLMPPVEEKRQLTSDTLIDISHESLISGWDKLRAWVNEEAESARLYKRLADTAILKDLGKEDYYRGPALQLALNWRKDNTPNQEWARRYHPEYDKAITFLDDSLKDTEKREKAEQERAARELRRTRTYNIILGILVVMSLSLGVIAIGAQRRMLITQEQTLKREQDRLVSETALKDAAVAEQVKAEKASETAKKATEEAVAANKKLNENLEIVKAAVKAANIAKATAIAERDKARRLQAENEEQAIEYKYFKTASDKLAEGDGKAAVSKLREALHHFEKKKLVTDTDKQENKSNIISTHINIADVFRNSENEGKSAIREYGRALDLMDKDDAPLRALTLMKAGHVRAKSKNEGEVLEAAGNYEEAATTYGDLGQRDEAIAAWIAAGTVFAKFQDNENSARARADFDKAVSASGNDKNLTAKTNAEIAASYVRLLDDAVKDEDVISRTRDNSATRANNEDRLREAGAEYFRKSARIYESIKELSSAASMSFKAGQMLSEGNSARLLEPAGEAFQLAVDLSHQAGQVDTEKSFLFIAGKAMARSKSPIGWKLADRFFNSYITISSQTEERKAGALRNIAQSYASLKTDDARRTASEYYMKASRIYKDLKELDDQLYVLIEAGNVLRQLHPPPIPTIEALDLEAFGVYAGDIKRQARTLNRIGDEYASSDELSQQKRAIDYYRHSAKLAHEAGDKEMEAEAILNAGRGLIETDEEDEGKRTLDSAVKVYEGDVLGQVVILSSIGTVYTNLEPAPFSDLARDYFQQAIVLAQKHDAKDAEVYAILAKAKGIKELDGEDAARAEVEPLYWQAIDVYKNNPFMQISVAFEIAKRIAGSGRDREQLKQAKPYFDRALAIAGNQPKKKMLADVHLEIGLLSESRDPEAAIQNYETALKISEAEGDRYGQAMAFYRLAVAGKKQESIDRALTLFNDVLPKVEASGNKKELADGLFAMGTVYRLKKDYKQALDSYERALAIYEKLPDDGKRHNTRTLIESVRRQMDPDR